MQFFLRVSHFFHIFVSNKMARTPAMGSTWTVGKFPEWLSVRWTEPNPRSILLDSQLQLIGIECNALHLVAYGAMHCDDLVINRHSLFVSNVRTQRNRTVECVHMLKHGPTTFRCRLSFCCHSEFSNVLIPLPVCSGSEWRRCSVPFNRFRMSNDEIQQKNHKITTSDVEMNVLHVSRWFSVCLLSLFSFSLSRWRARVF